MNQPSEQVWRSWEKVLNPAILHRNLIATSLFLTAYETLRSSVIIGRVRDYFSEDFDVEGPLVNEAYQTKVLALDKSPVRASLLWLRGMAIIEDSDIALMDAIRTHRNELAHNLPKFIASADAELDIGLFDGIHALVTKIDRWWIRDIEMACNPDFDGLDIPDSELISSNMIFIHLMVEVAAGRISSDFWDEIQQEVRKRCSVGGHLVGDPSHATP